MLHTGTPTRFELWSCAVVVVAVFVALAGRGHDHDSKQLLLMHEQCEILKKIDAKVLIINQNNVQKVTIESDLMKLAREILEDNKRTKKKAE